MKKNHVYPIYKQIDIVYLVSFLSYTEFLL